MKTKYIYFINITNIFILNNENNRNGIVLKYIGRGQIMYKYYDYYNVNIKSTIASYMYLERFKNESIEMSKKHLNIFSVLVSV